MSNREVAGLQALAKKHGGELSVNPDTGLPEAGFLDSILPTIAGAGLSYFTGMSPMMAAGLVGGITALDSKDLSKGLMAGLGAYGGAGLTGGLMTAGTGALTQQGIDAAGGAEALKYVPGGATGIAENVAGASNFDRLGAGVGDLFSSNAGRAMTAIGGGSQLAGAGMLGAAAAPIIADEMVETTTEAPPQDRGKIRPYTYSRQQVPQDYQDQQGNMGSRERRYFNDSYTAGDPYSAAGGGLVALAAGGYTNQNVFRPTTPLPENNMTGDSRDAYDYLMGNTNRTQVGTGPGVGDGTGEVDLQVLVYGPDGQMYSSPGAARRAGVYNYTMQPPSTNTGNTPPTGKGKYEFNPVTKQYTWVPDPVKPVDVAAPVPVNPVGGGGGGGRGEREPEDPNSFSAQWAAMSDTEKAAWQAENPGKAAFQEAIKFGLAPVAYLVNKAQNYFAPKDPDAYQRISPPDQFAGYQPNTRDPNGVPTPDIKTAPEGTLGSTPPQGDPAQQQQAAQQAAMQRAAAESNAAADRTYGGNQNNSGRTGRDATSGDGYGGGYGSVAAGYTGGSEAADGGLSTPYGFQHMAQGGIADLHQYNLGSYSDGGRLLKGPGDGVSDSIPATIGRGQPARLADGEFVIPARIVSELGNGSTDAGARALYKMMARIQAGRRKTVGKKQVAKNSKAARHLPA
jgi:hypothetical protein